GTLAIVGAAVLALGVLAGTTWQRSSVDGPQPAGGRSGLPDRIWSPSPWLEGTDDAGPLGQLAALVSGERGSWTGKSYGLAGISATTGEYRFLDLPDGEAERAGTALSPDGRHVAYWLTGTTTGSPNSDRGPVVGLGVYDTATGEVRRAKIPTEHGLDPYLLLWADADRVVFSAGQYVGGDADSLMDQSSSRLGRVLVWDLADEAPVALAGLGNGYIEVFSAGAGRIAVAAEHRRYRVIDLGDRSRDRRLELSEEVWGSLVVSPGGDRVAGVRSARREAGVDGVPNGLLAGSPPARRGAGVQPVQLARVPTSGRTFEVLSWIDEDHVAVERAVGDCCLGRAVFLDTVSTGASQQLVRFPDPRDIEVATDLLGAPTLPGVEPPRPLDPRVVGGLGTGTVVLALSALVLWRRRVRP
ncbi:MAG: hypothetical protein JWO76_1392, partial [Nocardioides sp.]|nr:hypothetical protein [Nocardioides sp.]